MTRAFLPLLLVCVLAPSAGAEEALVEVELLATPARVFVHQPVEIRLRVSLDRDAFRHHAVPLFRRAMDLALDVRAPALADLPPAEAPDGPSFVLNGELVRADRVREAQRGGRTWLSFEVLRHAVFEVPGDLLFPPPEVHFATARAFEEDFLGSRVPIDREDVRIRGDAPSLRVLALPTEGRPAGFRDAVGHFALRAEAEPGNEGAHRLILTLTGEGNLETLTPPALPPAPAFHLLGVLDAHEDGVRTLTYDLAPIPGADAVVPAVEFATFDPTPPAAYRVLRTEPLRLDRREAKGLPVDEPPAPAWLVLVLSLGLALGGWAVLVRHRQKAAGRTPSATPEPEGSFPAVLASILGVPEPALVCEDLGARLVAAGCRAEDAARAADLLTALVASRYGGPEVPDEAAAVREVVAALRVHRARR